MFKRLIFSFEKTPKLTFTWHCFKKDLEKRSIVENMLPSNHNHNISSFKPIQKSDIKNESKFEAGVGYYINMTSGLCECKAGLNCGPCKHKKAISTHKGLAEFSVLPEHDPKMRAMYHYIAEATFCQNAWYRELENPEVIEDVSEFIEKRTNNHEVLPIPAGFGEANESVQ